MSLEKVFPFMAQDGGTVAFDLESTFSVFGAVCIMCSSWSVIGHYVGSHAPSLVPRPCGNEANNVE